MIELTDNFQTLKVKCGKYLVPLELKLEDDRIIAKFKYNKTLIEDIKSLQGARWNPDYKFWHFPNSERNLFQLRFMSGENVYENYDKAVINHVSNRPIRKHQAEMIGFSLVRHFAILAGEMGTGKTLVALEVMEHSGVSKWWYVCPKNVMYAIYREFSIWDAKLQPMFLTYNALTNLAKNFIKSPETFELPQGILFDESVQLKTPTSQRSQAARLLADAVRHNYPNGYVILLSGAPAPKSPSDWWHQAEVACPGFIKEGDIFKFNRRLGIVVEKESPAGGVYPHLVTWKNDTNKCDVCGELKDADCHDSNLALAAGLNFHNFVPSVNEVSKLYERLKGLVLVKFKRDCLDLPEKQYKLIKIKPLEETLRGAELIKATSPTVIEALTKLRELSDGFQYQLTRTGRFKMCPGCNGKQNITALGGGEEPCPHCAGTGKIETEERITVEVPCPKDIVVDNLLEEYEEQGRVVIYAGLTGSVDRCVNLCLKNKWNVIRVDGRGWQKYSEDENFKNEDEDDLTIFQDLKEKYPKVAFIGQPGAAGMGLTLTASSVIIYFSNDFNANSRIQSEDRIHRMGMDANRGAMIIDLIHLPSDEQLLNNLKLKRELQAMSLNDLKFNLDAEYVDFSKERER